MTESNFNEVKQMVRFEQITKRFSGCTTAVDQLNLTIGKGQFVVLIGPSGCGKTTTLKMVNRLIEPTSGEIYIHDQNARALNVVELRRDIGYVIQTIGLLPHLTVAANIALVPQLKGWSRAKCQARVEELLTMVDMEPAVYAGRYPAQLSGGQQQRIGVLRALAADPELILMDEPFGALDPITREQLQLELKRLQGQLKKTIVFVTHDMSEALLLADRIIITGRRYCPGRYSGRLSVIRPTFCRQLYWPQCRRRRWKSWGERCYESNPVTIAADRGLGEP